MPNSTNFDQTARLGSLIDQLAENAKTTDKYLEKLVKIQKEAEKIEWI